MTQRAGPASSTDDVDDAIIVKRIELGLKSTYGFERSELGVHRRQGPKGQETFGRRAQAWSLYCPRETSDRPR